MSEHFNKALGRWIVSIHGGTRYRHRYRMEQHLGRALATDEHVHHINGDKTDDRVENLVVMPAADHARLHTQDRERGKVARREHDWAAEHERCTSCGTTARKHAGNGLCSRCYFRDRARRIHDHAPRKAAICLSLICERCGAEFTRTSKQGYKRYYSKSCASTASANARWTRRRAGDSSAIGKVAA